MPTTRKTTLDKAKPFKLGRAHFAKISKVEGIVVTAAMTKRFASSQGKSGAEARKVIIKTYKAKR